MVDSTNLPEVDINAIATDLNNKMDRDGSNVETLSQTFMNMFMPDYANAESISGKSYTASKNGYVNIYTFVISSGGTLRIKINNKTVGSFEQVSHAERLGGMIFPVKKGDVIALSGTSNEPYWQFIPFYEVNS